MGHCIQAIVCRREVVLRENMPAGWPEPVELAQGYVLIPMFESVLDAISSEAAAEKFQGFTYLSRGLLTFLSALSGKLPLAYIETEYFGGAGDQAPFAARGGRIILEPTHGEDSINRALVAIGVHRLTSIDEFDALNLGAFRRMSAFDDFDRF